MNRYEARPARCGWDVWSGDGIAPITHLSLAEAYIIAWALNAVAEGRIVVKLMPPERGGPGVQYAGYYCEKYDGPTGGVAPPPAEVRS